MITASQAFSKPPRATFRSFLKSNDTRHHLTSALQQVGDSRRKGPRLVPMGAVLQAAVIGFASGLKAVKSWDDNLRHRAASRRFLRAARHSGAIADDTFRLAFESASLGDLQDILRQQAKRELKRWSTGPHTKSRLGTELCKLGANRLAAYPVLAIDGHWIFSCKTKKCAECTPLKNSDDTRWGHRIVVAQWVGSHPAMIVDFEPVRSPEGEVTAAKRLLKRVTKHVPDAFKVLLLDALYDSEPMRYAIVNAKLHYVIRHKDPNRSPGGEGVEAILERDPERKKPDGVFLHRDGHRVDVWQEFEAPNGRRTVAFSLRDGSLGACVTNLPEQLASPCAVTILMMERWSQENTGFHELAGQMNLDRAYVHKGRANAVWTVVAVALIAYNAWQSYIYQTLGIDPMRPGRSWADLRIDLWCSLGDRDHGDDHHATGPPNQAA